MIKEYTEMVDIGITPIPKIETASQTDLVLHAPIPQELGLVSEVMLTDAEIRSKLYDPVIATCPRLIYQDADEEKVRLYKFGDFYRFSEQVLSRRELMSGARISEQAGARMLVSEEQDVGELGARYYQEQIVDCYARELKDPVMISRQCLKLLKTISKLDKDGILYATTIAKVFGFKKVPNYHGLVT